VEKDAGRSTYPGLPAAVGGGRAQYSKLGWQALLRFARKSERRDRIVRTQDSGLFSVTGDQMGRSKADSRP
jgi:hypothetical protein